MSKINNGGSAFPNEVSLNTCQRGGMTMRDYFAAKAMQSYLRHSGEVPMDRVAATAYAMADFMLRARGEA